jgi:hypothetical protein
MEDKKYLSVIPIIIIGTNLHGGVYPIYLILAAYYMFQEMPVKKYLKYLTFYFLLVMINPYGYNIYLYTIRVLTHNDFSNFISEWNPVTPAKPIILLICYLLLIISVRDSKIKLKDELFILGFAVISLMSVRHLVFLFLFCFTIASKYILEELVKINNILKRFAIYCKKYPLLNFKQVDIKFLDIRLEFILFGLLIFMLYFGIIEYSKNEVIDETSPIKAIQYIKESKITRIYNNYNFGGFLIFNDIPTMIDGRADLFTPKFNNTNLFKEYADVSKLKIDYMEFFNKYKIKNVFVYKSEPLSFVLNKDKSFNKIYDDESFCIYSLKEEE